MAGRHPVEQQIRAEEQAAAEAGLTADERSGPVPRHARPGASRVPQLLSAHDIAELSGLSSHAVLRAIRSGELKAS